MRESGSTTTETGQDPPVSKQTIYVHKDTLDLNSADSTTTSIDSDFEVCNIFLHFSAATSTKVTVSVDSNEGSNYDTVIWERTLSSDTDVAILYAANELVLNKGDELKIATTADGTDIVGYVTVYYRLK